ncbi:hypothetical protein ACFL2U_00265 [Patescibacteria group bacterium]
MKRVFFAVVVVVIFMATQAEAGVRLAGYYDTREQENITVVGYSALPYNFGVWGFVDFYTNRADSETGIDDEADFTSFYSEANINFALTKNLKLLLEINDGSAIPANFRPGLQYWIPVENGTVGVKFAPYRIDLVQLDPEPDPSGQIGLAWRFDFLEKKVFFEGFAEINWRYGDHQDDFYPFITEPQLGVNLSKNMAILIEYRYSALNPVTKEADEGWGIGAEYRF